jgi:hypothetical protein
MEKDLDQKTTLPPPPGIVYPPAEAFPLPVSEAEDFVTWLTAELTENV